jgi:hypothetical protein
MSAEQFVTREAQDDFGAFKIGQACLNVGGKVVCVTAAPLTVFDHIQGYARIDESRRLRWIVYMVLPAGFDIDKLDEAIEKEG